jgi:hypothetical protein
MLKGFFVLLVLHIATMVSAEWAKVSKENMIYQPSRYKLFAQFDSEHFFEWPAVFKPYPKEQQQQQPPKQ